MTRPMVEHLMVQQQIRGPHREWKHMVAVMCLNLTYRKHVKIILPRLFQENQADDRTVPHVGPTGGQ
jgi:hypothetical protein